MRRRSHRNSTLRSLIVVKESTLDACSDRESGPLYFHIVTGRDRYTPAVKGRLLLSANC